MKCLQCVRFVLIYLTLNSVASGAEIKIREERRALIEQIEILKTLHLADVSRLRGEFEEFKKQLVRSSDEDQPLDSMVIKDLRAEISEIRDSLRSTAGVQDELFNLRKELKQSLAENAELSTLARGQQQRVEQLELQVALLKQHSDDERQAHTQLNTLLYNTAKKFKDFKAAGESKQSTSDFEDDPWEQHAHNLRHQKTMFTKVHKIAREQEILDRKQNNLQSLVLDVQTRMDHFQEPNWNLLSTKVEMLELETEKLREDVKNNTQKLSDLDKLHASVLELREVLEGIESKADKAVPELRMEISKLDINYAQLNAQSSYLKEDQENLRQSVKAIAVSISNAIDRAQLDRDLLRRINSSLRELDERARQQHYRLNDHILKSEANHDFNQTETIPLPELMGEVKELQPVESEYQDLVRQLPRDCSQVTGAPGVYLIRPGLVPRDAWCAAGGTVLQRRINGSIEFNRKFAEYARGFGDAAAEHWLGLDAMHHLTADNCSSMRIDMTDIYGGAWYAEYKHFYVGNAGSGYALELSDFKGNASDAFEYQNHMEFSAIDHDRDISNTHCAANYEGGWWWSHCQHVNINGKYTLGLTWFDSARNEWIAVATTEMRLYRRPNCA